MELKLSDNIVIAGLFFALVALFYPVFKDMFTDPQHLLTPTIALLFSGIYAALFIIVIVILSFVSNKKCKDDPPK
jgi:hypothetical protein